VHASGFALGMLPRARLLDLGRRRYAPVLEFQRALHAAVVSGSEPETWLVVEHEPVVTLGRNAKETNVLLPRPMLAAAGVDIVEVERGGDVTYHGPGQVVVYPIRKLARFREVQPLVNAIENAVIDTLRRFEITAHRRPEHRGVYVGGDAICAVGLAVRQMVSLHGLALNACTALDYDRLITPCGTPEFGITSIAEQTGRDVSWGEARDVLLDCLEGAFSVQFAREVIPPGAPLPFPNRIPETA
jgi:lipoate-protein ligase B